MEVRYPHRDEGAEENKVLLFIQSRYSPDAAVTLEELIELRAEIDKFLFLRLALNRTPNHG